MAQLPAQYREGWPAENAVYRTARKAHRCEGDGSRHTAHASACPVHIQPGTAYVEYLGDALPFQAGSAHSIPCALQFGFITLAPNPPTND